MFLLSKPEDREREREHEINTDKDILIGWTCGRMRMLLLYS